MKTPVTTKIVLLLSGLIVAGIGFAILIFPAQFYATNGIDLGGDPSLFNEVRASGGALVGVGGLILAGLCSPKLVSFSLSVSTVMYGAYGMSRLLSMVIDGLPHPGIIGATAVELIVAAWCLLVLVRGFKRRKLVVAGSSEAAV